MFSIRKNPSTTSDLPQEKFNVFFDIPTTLVAFEGTIEEIENKTKRAITNEEKEIYFDDFKKDFFACAEEWAIKERVTLIIINIDNNNAIDIAERIAKRLDARIN